MTVTTVLKGDAQMSHRKRLELNSTDTIAFAILIVGIVVIGIILTLVFRAQRGLLGVALAGLAVVLLAYWLKEIRETLKKEWGPVKPPKEVGWAPEIIKTKDEIVIVAEVPGPEERVKANLRYRTLEIVGGRTFRKTMELQEDFERPQATYKNGVLSIRLTKRRMSSCAENPSPDL